MDFSGSVTRDDFDSETSDVDVLVEFDLSKRFGFEFIQVIDDLSEVFGGKQVV